MPRGVNDFDNRELQGLDTISGANPVNILSPGGIVRDGLVLNVDAGNFHSYPLTGTTVYDLSGRRNNGLFNNSPTYSREGAGSIRITGSIDWVGFSSPTLTNKSCTLCFWLRPNSPGQYGCPFSVGLANGSQIFVDNTTGGYYWLGGGFNGQTYLYTQSNTSSVFNSVIITFDATNATCYHNGVQTAQTISTDFNTASTLNLGIRNGQNGWAGYHAMFMVYNRPLLKEEVSQNFNATRARFNV